MHMKTISHYIGGLTKLQNNPVALFSPYQLFFILNALIHIDFLIYVNQEYERNNI